MKCSAVPEDYQPLSPPLKLFQRLRQLPAAVRLQHRGLEPAPVRDQQLHTDLLPVPLFYAQVFHTLADNGPLLVEMADEPVVDGAVGLRPCLAYRIAGAWIAKGREYPLYLHGLHLQHGLEGVQDEHVPHIESDPVDCECHVNVFNADFK